MSAFLIEPARKAAKAKRWGRAIALYEAAVVARGPGSPAALELARAWLGAGQHAEARAALVDVAARATDDALRADARADLERLAQLDEPAARGLSLPRLNREARAAYQRGREAFRRKRYADALVYFEMGNALDPDQAGYLREIGATYDKLGLADDKRDFFLDHLRQRPFGQGATYLRKALGAKRLGTLTITTSLPCDEVWLNGQRVTGRLPLRKLAAAPGRYKALCVSYEYEIAYFEYARVTAGQAAELAFRWALIVNELRDPFGRIAIENARDATVMMDLGISSPEVGVIIPADGRALRMLLKDDAGTRVEERFVTLTAGQRLVIKW